MSDHESPDRTVHVKDQDQDQLNEPPTPDAPREGAEEADAEDPSLGGSSDGDTSA
jgi:hypothetical protein